MKYNQLSILVISGFFLLNSCANVVSPQGGDKDTKPPEALSFSPANGTTNFTYNSIEILFDEYIQATDIFNQVVVSPPMFIPPTFKVKSKKLIIQLNESLRDSTTYTINFGSSIKDITESNVLDNFIYVFSTGDILDSLVVEGNIKNIRTGKPEKNTYAVLYPSIIDSNFKYSSPWYFAKASENGNFAIPNIKEGSYNLYAVLDQNFNYYYDLPNEMIAFSDSAITIDSIKNYYTLQLFSEENIRQQLLDARAVLYGSLRFVFAKRVDDVEIIPITLQDKNYLIERNYENDTVYYWSIDSTLKEIQFNIKYDTIDSLVTINAKNFPANFKSLTIPLKSTIQGTSKSVSSKNQPYLFDLNKSIELLANNPIQFVDSTKIILYKDSSTIVSDIIFKKDSIKIRQLNVAVNLESNTSYILQIKKDAVTDIFGLKNDSITIYFKTREKKDYGNLKVKIQTEIVDPILIELLKEDLSIVISGTITKEKSEITMPLILPGTYLLRATIDKNNNGLWDTGNLDNKIQPETILYFENFIPIRSNWDQNIDWIITH